MRKFNPEKELNKIQRGNKNKIIIFVVLLLVVSIMSYSFALYQVRYSKRIIYTKVAPFSNKDLILSFLVDGQNQNKLPDKNTGYYYDGIECENDPNATAKWDYENWKLTMLTATVPNKCDIKFTSTPSTLIAQIKNDKETNPESVVEDETSDKNLRYIGKNPNNYIWFNCDNYELVTNNATAEEQQCEKWRIIGLMNNMTIIDEETQTNIHNQSLVKIIRKESLGKFTLTEFKTNINSLYYNGTEYGNGKGITAETKTMIEKVKLGIGTPSNLHSYTTLDLYTTERGTNLAGSGPTWDAYIGVMYPSDYGFATSGAEGDNTYNREACIKSDLYNWNNNNQYDKECAGNDWLGISGEYQLTMTSTSSYVCLVREVRNVDCEYLINYVGPAHPSLYLNSQIKILGGVGSDEEPYIIVP